MSNGIIQTQNLPTFIAFVKSHDNNTYFIHNALAHIWILKTRFENEDNYYCVFFCFAFNKIIISLHKLQVRQVEQNISISNVRNISLKFFNRFEILFFNFQRGHIHCLIVSAAFLTYDLHHVHVSRCLNIA